MISQHVPAKLLTRLTKIEQEYIEQFSLCSAVDNALLIGNPLQIDLLKSCRSRHRHLLCEKYSHSRAQAAQVCVGAFNDLPYAKESMDLIILPHVLEFSNEPNIILNEAAECLSKSGTLLLFSLSPFSRFDSNKTGAYFSPLSAYRAKQLLIDADLEVIATQSFFSLFGYASETKIAQFIDKIIAPHLSFLCNAYFIAAQKTTYTTTFTPIKSYVPQKFALALENSCSSQQENI